MHTDTFTIEGQEYRVHHDGDWTGGAEVVRPDGTSVRLPTALLRAIGARLFCSRALAAVEEALDGIDREASREAVDPPSPTITAQVVSAPRDEVLASFTPKPSMLVREGDVVRVTLAGRGAEPPAMSLEIVAEQKPQPGRCAVCGWPLKATIDEGCTEESCSERGRQR